MVNCSHVNHCCVGSRTILLVPQVTVWWKLWGYKFTDHLCVTFRCDCDGFSAFILKEVGSNDSAGPNSTPNGNFWLIKGALVMFIRICSRSLTKVPLINCAMPMKMCRITYQKVVGLNYQSIFPENDDKIASVPLCPDYSMNAKFAICMGEDSGHYAGCAIHSRQTCPSLERAYVQITSDCGRWTPTFRQCSWACKLRTVDQVAFYTWKSLLHATTLPSNQLHLEMVFLADWVHREICTESL